MKAEKVIAAALVLAAAISFAGCKGKTAVDPANTSASDNAMQNESGNADAAESSAEQTNVKISAYYIGIGLNKQSRWRMTEESCWDEKSSKYVKTETAEYDSDGNLISDIRYNSSSEPYTEDKYKYTYNSNGTVKEIIRSGSRECVYRYEYDSGKRISKISTLNADSGAEEDALKLTYNNAGKLICAQNGSKKAEFSYDGNGRLVRKDTSGSDGYLSSDIFEYNSRGELIRETIGQNSDGMAEYITEYQYDENGSLAKEVTKNYHSKTYEYEYKNDEHGNPIEIKYTETEYGQVSDLYTETYSYEYGAKKIVVSGGTDRKKTQKVYEYRKDESVITPESDLF